MEAATLKCPMCGASATDDATRCGHCGARLATIACPSCFGMMFLGEKFCPRCGGLAARAEASSTEPRNCPRCHVKLGAVAVGSTNLHECPRCEGIWVDAAALERICTDRESQATLLGVVSQLPAPAAGAFEANVRYVPCPVCRMLMNRVNFTNCSHVIIDVCKPHGTWFDRDELGKVVEFIRAGGMQAAYAKEVELLAERKRSLRIPPGATSDSTAYSSFGTRSPGWSAGLTIAEGLLQFFMRR